MTTTTSHPSLLSLPTEINGQAGSLEFPLELPSAVLAYQTQRVQCHAKSCDDDSNSSPKKSRLAQPSVTSKPRRRCSATQKKGVSLPPPPSRSRKIIQMNPRSQEIPVEPLSPTKTPPLPAIDSEAGPRKQSTATQKKISRKTAHSVIERRRRDKMNKEFALLKDLIPACSGDMHKLAILQEAIEYIRYLKDCNTTLKSEHEYSPLNIGKHDELSSPSSSPLRPEFEEDAMSPVKGDDIEMGGSEPVSPISVPRTVLSPLPELHPAARIGIQAHSRDGSLSSTSTVEQQRFSCDISSDEAIHTSADGSQLCESRTIGDQDALPHLNLVNPALGPQGDLHQEATAALLMLNRDPRNHFGYNNKRVSEGARGLSVRDLLDSSM